MNNRTLLCWSLCHLLFALPFISRAQTANADTPPSQPVEVEVDLSLYKIFDVNTVDETYQADGYFQYSWKDERMKFDPDSLGVKQKRFVGDRLSSLIEQELWFPPLEFINTHGKRNSDFTILTIDPDGSICYKERFNAQFRAEMDLSKFPFDMQTFKIEIEPFSYTSREVLLVNEDKEGPHSATKDSSSLLTNWQIIKTYPYQETTIGYNESELENDSYSHIDFVIEAERLAGYYIWQLLFPLMIIILASVVIFWINDFGTQIQVGFTLMLTVVAYNFYSASLLPKLPYNTFIETVIMLGYVFILLSIIAVVHKNYLGLETAAGKRAKLLYKILYPTFFVLALGTTVWYYYG